MNSCGVPHGTILGPLLFLIYNTDMHSPTSLHCLHFADDISVFTLVEWINFFNDKLCKIFKWLCTKYLCLNVGKSCSTVVTNKHIETSPVRKIHNIRLYFSCETKFIRITVETKLLFAWKFIYLNSDWLPKVALKKNCLVIMKSYTKTVYKVLYIIFFGFWANIEPFKPCVFCF